MTWGAVAMAGAAVVGGIYSANEQSKAANKAADAQTSAANQGIAEQQRQFDAIQKLLAPYVSGGTAAFQQQQDLIGTGTGGTAAQQQAIAALQASPAYTSALQAGNNNILANASATGGLRGGNVQGALGQFAPAVLAATINDRFNQLGTISQQGLGAATNTGSFGQATANNVTNLLGNIGGYQAGNALAQGNAQAGYANAIQNGIGTYFGLRGAGAPAAGGFGNYTPNASQGLSSYGINGMGDYSSVYSGGF